MKKIPCNVQALLIASSHINNHCRAVEELVYNALDARATCIAIRINIQENILQVIDNGHGVSKKDLKVIGMKNMTSKFVDLNTLKSAPNAYGFRGEGLANIINVSKSVKIVSQCENSEETWMKYFEYGKEKQVNKCNTQISRGTMVEITGFLYNSLLKNNVKETMGDIQSIKTFLEHLSLINCDISISLRDDVRNKIIFKMHKNRDIYQTLSSLYNINKNDLTELKVEKNNYKVRGYFGKTDIIEKHLIFLNGKCITKMSKLHKILNKNFSKHNSSKGIRKLKLKNMHTEEDNICFQNSIPEYFVFIKCPSMDYDLYNLPKQSILEFKDWTLIEKLLEKIVAFFFGDVNLKEVNLLHNNHANNINHGDTREQVKKIMEKFLGTNTKKPAIAHMHNAVKGKQVKRKYKISTLNKNEDSKKCTDRKNKYIIKKNSLKDSHVSYNTKENRKLVSNNFPQLVVSKSIHIGNTSNLQLNNSKPNLTKSTHIDKENQNKGNIELGNDRKRGVELEQTARNIIEQFHKQTCLYENNLTDYNVSKSHINVSVRKQIDEIIIDNKSSRYKTNLERIANINKNETRKMVKSNYDLLNTILKSQRENDVNNIVVEPFKITRNNTTPKISDLHLYSAHNLNKSVFTEQNNNLTEPTATFKSHNYHIHQMNNPQNMYSTQEQIPINNQHCLQRKLRTFITKQSRHNFVIPSNDLKNKKFKALKRKKKLSTYIKSHIKNLFKQTSKLFDLKKQIMGNPSDTSSTFEFTKTNCKLTCNNEIITNRDSSNSRMNMGFILSDLDTNFVESSQIHTIKKHTYTVTDVTQNLHGFYNEKLTCNGTYTVTNKGDNDNINNAKTQIFGLNSEQGTNNRNFIFLSKSLGHNGSNELVDPLNVCEPILISDEILNKEFVLSFSENLLTNNQNINSFQQVWSDNLDSNEKELPNHHSQCHQEIILQDNMVSHHFSPIKKLTSQINYGTKNTRTCPVSGQNIEKQLSQTINKFNFVGRACFLPKGMSPILQNCQTKKTCEYNLSRDYFEKEMYENFAENVQSNADIYELKIQDVKENVPKYLHKVNTKLNKDFSALKFNGQSLRDAKVLGQIDEKFIGAVVRSACDSKRYLVLFDQHAVHERIRLENNLTDYFIEDHWRVVNIDPVSLNLNKDSVLYLHNYREKFEQLGLRWTVTNDHQVSVIAIPQAVLGKNPRQVERIIKAVKNLIAEEINVIKTQGGCSSLYPKSIIDLVFSEACRYAIKFGDKVSKAECMKMLQALSNCKTPFQCAHGRPVMTVITEINLKKIDYKININKIMEWSRK